MIQTGIVNVTRREKIAAYLTGLKWDGVPRVDPWALTYLGQRTLEGAGEWLIGAASRALCPGVYARGLALIGGQGCGRSSALAVLSGGAFSSSFDPFSRDGYMEFEDSWIVELFEEHAGRKLDALVGRTEVRHRRPYTADMVCVPVSCVFAAAVSWENRTRFGSTAWVQVYCGSQIDVDGLRRDRDQLWAEATARALIRQGMKSVA